MSMDRNSNQYLIIPPPGEFRGRLTAAPVIKLTQPYVTRTTERTVTTRRTMATAALATLNNQRWPSAVLPPTLNQPHPIVTERPANLGVLPPVLLRM